MAEIIAKLHSFKLSYIYIYIYISVLKSSDIELGFSNLPVTEEDRGGTVVKVLYYKLEGRWFDSRWRHWNFSLI